MSETEPCDFLGRAIREGDEIVYPVSTGSSGAHMVKGKVLAVVDGKDRWGRSCAQLRVRGLADSRYRGGGRSARPITLTNISRCVVVS